MSDIVTRLSWGCLLVDDAWERGVDVGRTEALLDEAAAEITRLRAQLAVAREGLEEISDDWGNGGPSIAANTLAKMEARP